MLLCMTLVLGEWLLLMCIRFASPVVMAAVSVSAIALAYKLLVFGCFAIQSRTGNNRLA